MMQNIFVPKQGTAAPSVFQIPDIDEIAGLVVNSEGKSSFDCNQAYGINSNSRNKKLAWEFINL